MIDDLKKFQNSNFCRKRSTLCFVEYGSCKKQSLKILKKKAPCVSLDSWKRWKPTGR